VIRLRHHQDDGRKAKISDLLVDRLIEWDVRVVFGLPGDGINGFMEALRVRRDRIAFIHVRHEESAAFMASGYAKFTGRLGVCLATSGPGAIHLLNGLYDAKLDGVPVLAITGQTYHDLVGMRYQQEVDLLTLFKDVALFNQQIMGAAGTTSLVDAACRSALGARGVAHINCPVDLQEQELGEDEKSEKNVPGHTSSVWQPSVAAAPADDVRRAAALLNAGRKTVIIAGFGAIGAHELLEQAAEKMAAPIVKPLRGKAVVPDDSPYTTGGIGLLGTAPSEKALEECDSLLIAGSSFPYMEFYPKPGAATAVQIDHDSTRIGLRYPVDAGLVGDTRATLETLVPLLERRADRRFLQEAQDGMRDWRELMEDRATRKDSPLKPQVVIAELSRQLSDDALIACDTGATTTWVARHMDIRGTRAFAVSGNLATMAPALPYAIAAQVAYPERQCIAIAGDGSLAMLMGELATLTQHKLPVKVVVVRNDTLGMIKWEQMVFLGYPEYGCALSPIDFARVANGCGIEAFRCDKAKHVRDRVRAFLATEGPALLEAIVDPYEPPMPARIKPKQAIHLAKALAKGEPHRGRIALTLFRNKVHELLE
jgi:pyruvate dehydrogenase (quinone)